MTTSPSTSRVLVPLDEAAFLLDFLDFQREQTNGLLVTGAPTTKPSQTAARLRSCIASLLQNVGIQTILSETDIINTCTLAATVRATPGIRLVRRLAASCGVSDAGSLEQMCDQIARTLLRQTRTLLAQKPSPDVVRRGWVKLRALMALIFSWLHPGGRRPVRRCEAVHRLFALVSSLAGLCFVMSHQTNRVVLKITRAFPRDLHAHLLGCGSYPAAVDVYFSLLQSFWSLDRLDASYERGFQYVWFCPWMLYWGFACEARTRWTGYSGRSSEHYSDLARAISHPRESEQKYLLFAKYEPHNIFFLPQYHGTVASAFAREQLAIRLVPTLTNRKEKRPNHIPPRTGRPLHLWERERLQKQAEKPEQRSLRLNFTHMVYFSDEQRAPESVAWTHMTFDQLYCLRIQARAAVTGQVGPLHLFHESQAQLLVVWLSTGSHRRLELYPRRYPKSVWMAASLSADFLPTASRRRSAQIRIRYCLRQFGIGGGKSDRLSISVDRHEHIPTRLLRGKLAGVLRAWEAPTTVDFIQKNLILSRTKIPSVHEKGRQHRVLARNFDRTLFLTIPPEQQRKYLQGESVRFIPASMDLPRPDFRISLEAQTMKLAFQVADFLNAKYLRTPLLRSLMPAVRKRLTLPCSWATPEVLSVWNQLPGKHSTEVLAKGDKDNKTGLVVDRGFLYTWFDRIFWHDDDHIEHLDLTPDQMRYRLYWLHLAHVPEEFQIKSWKAWESADVSDYIEPKEKCFSAGCRTCTKALDDPCHKCFRRISSHLLPTKNLERTAARCVECLGKHDGRNPITPGDEDVDHYQVWNCDDFTDGVKRGLSGLEFLPEFLNVCIECRGPKGLVSFSHGDSSAMYDAIREEETVSCFDKSRRRVECRTQKTGVTIMSGRHHHAFLAGGPRDGERRPHRVRNRRLLGSRFIGNKKTRSILVYSGVACFSRIGRHVFRRKQGVTMGGPLSPAKSGLVYRQRERTFNRHPRRWNMWSMGRLQGLGRPMRCFTFAVRIADDDFVASSVHCPACTGKKLEKVYTHPLKHESQEEGTSVQVTDISVELVGVFFRIVRPNKNARFILGMPEQLRTRYLPSLRPPLVSSALRTCWLAGSLALDWRRQPALPHRMSQGLLACFELLRLGHDPKEVSIALRRVSHPQLRGVARALAKVMKLVLLERPSQARLPRLCLELVTPWAKGFPCLAMIPGAVS